MRLGVRVGIFLVGGIAACLVLLLQPSPTVASLQSLAVVIGAVSLAVFAAHGGHRVSVTGLFAMFTALIMGYGSWEVIGLDGPSAGLHTVLAATALGIVACVPLMSGPLAARGEVQPMHASHARVFVLVGLVTAPALIPFRSSLPLLLHEGMALMSVVLLAVGIIFGPGRRRSLLAPLLVAPHLALYSEFFHGGTGRLRLVGLVGMLVVLYTFRHPRWWHKPAMLAVAPLGLAYLARDRVEYQIENFGSSNSTGLESMFASSRTFAQLVEAMAAGKEGPHWGASFLSPLTSIIPDPLHLDRMPGIFPYELVRWSNPHLYDTGFSTAGSYFGEWWWNFGAAGIVLAALVTGPLLGVLDRLVSGSLARLHESPRRALWACTVLAFGGAVGDLVWAGQHTWFVRGVARLPLLALMAFIIPNRPPEPKRVPLTEAERWLRKRDQAREREERRRGCRADATV